MKVKRIAPAPKKKPARIMAASLEVKKYAPVLMPKITSILEYEAYNPRDFWEPMRPGALDHEKYPSRFGDRRIYLREWQKDKQHGGRNGGV